MMVLEGFRIRGPYQGMIGSTWEAGGKRGPLRVGQVAKSTEQPQAVAKKLSQRVNIALSYIPGP